jgi:Protein of unknown function (DUF3017)
MMAEPQAPAGPAEPDPAPPEPRRWSWLGRQWSVTLVLLIAVVGLAVIGDQRFRSGSVILAGALLLAAWLRALLPERLVGLLRLRSRITDVLVLAVFGLGTAVLALAVPAAR